MPVSRNTLWDVICRSASSFVEVGHAGKTLYLPVCLTNLRKRRFAAGALTGELPVLVLPLDGRLEIEVITALCKELNDCYCLSLPATPALDRGSESPTLDLDGNWVVAIGSSHAGKLLAASLETKFLKLPHQSQTPEAAEDLADQLVGIGLTDQDVVYIDLLSNHVYLGTDEDGNSIEPFKDKKNRWPILGSLGAVAKPQLRRILDRLEAIRAPWGGKTYLPAANPALRRKAVLCCKRA